MDYVLPSCASSEHKSINFPHKTRYSERVVKECPNPFERTPNAVNDVLALIDNLGRSVSLWNYRVVGDCVRYAAADRIRMGEITEAIMRRLRGEGNIGQENFLIWGTPGQGKTTLVEELGASIHDFADFRHIYLSRENKESFSVKLTQLQTVPKPLLCLIDEVDANLSQQWPYEVMLDILGKPRKIANTCYVLVGSTGNNVDELEAAIGSRRSPEGEQKGKDVMRRITFKRKFDIPPTNLGDRILIFLSQLTRKTGKSRLEVEKPVLLYLALHKQLNNPSKVGDLAEQISNRMEAYENKVTWGHLSARTPGDNTEVLAFHSIWEGKIQESSFICVENEQVLSIGRDSKKTSHIFVAKDTNDLELLENKMGFLENPLRGKFVEQRIGWKELKEVVVRDSFDYFKWDVDRSPPSLDGPTFRMFFVVGKYGTGKSTFMVKLVDTSLLSSTSWFKAAVFINPDEMILEEDREIIRKELSLCLKENSNIILAVDALFREGDTKKNLKKKFEFLTELAKTFKIVITLRNSEFEFIKRLDRSIGIDIRDRIVRLVPSKRSTEAVLMNWLNYYNVEFESGKPDFQEAVQLLHEKEDGNLPYYIHHLVKTIYLRKEAFSKKKVTEIPGGMYKLILHTIEKELLLQNDISVSLSLLALLKQREALPFSSSFLTWIGKTYSNESDREDIELKYRILEMYLEPRLFDPTDTASVRFRLDDLWKKSIRLAMSQPADFADFECVESFSQVNQIYENFKLNIAMRLREFLESAFKSGIPFDKAPYFANLLLDWGKIDPGSLIAVADLFESSRKFIAWSGSQLSLITSELSLALFLSALDFRDNGNLEKAEMHLEKILTMKESVDRSILAKALLLYINTMERKLEAMESEHSGELIERIRSFYKELHDLNPYDSVPWQSQAVFYRKIGEHKEAAQCFEKAVAIDNTHVSTLQAYAIFLNEMANRLWRTNRKESETYLTQAQELFRQGRKIAAENGFSEKEILNAYANFLVDKAPKARFEERLEILEEADDIFKETQTKYPRHIHTRNSYANFLVKTGWRLGDRYPGGRCGKSLEIAEMVLRMIIKKNNDPLSQHTLAHARFTKIRRSVPVVSNSYRDCIWRQRLYLIFLRETQM